MQSIRIFARLGDGSLRHLVRQHDTPEWQWVEAEVDVTTINGDVVLSVDGIADLPKGSAQIGIVT